jgi:hypothetical protein
VSLICEKHIISLTGPGYTCPRCRREEPGLFESYEEPRDFVREALEIMSSDRKDAEAERIRALFRLVIEPRIQAIYDLMHRRAA